MASSSSVIESTFPQAEDKWIRQSCGFYACPTCKQPLEPAYDGLSCRVCATTYPILGGIPDFNVVNLEESRNFSLRWVGKSDSGVGLNFAASMYEPCVYPVVSNLYGGWRCTSLNQLAQDINAIIGSQDGLILDVACGPGTYGRRIASASRTVLGVDICMSMLRRGAHYVEEGHIPNVHFARATVEALPFRAGLFDAAICAGSLNHFSDTVLALREINRTMKAGAPLAGMCFVAGSEGLMKYKSLQRRAEKKGGHIFELPDLERYVTEAGFEDFRSHLYGSIVVFSARKKPRIQ
jgi:SAM-dependent methyltransferase